MGFESGGYAAKLGDRYEGKWVIRQLFQLLHEQIASVTIEPVGDDEEGVDLWIERLDGSRDAQQCKAQNGTKAYWSIADLDRRGVLVKAKNQLVRDPDSTFTFVSSIPATALVDLSRSARDSTGDSRHFYDHQVVGRSKNAKQEFERFCECLQLSPEDPDDLASAFDLLQRLHFRSFEDDKETRKELKLWAQCSASGEPEHVVNAIAAYAESNPRRRITTIDLSGELNRVDLPIRKMIADERTSVRLSELNSEFSDSIKPYLAAQQLIPRDETKSLRNVILDDEEVDAVVLHGDAGDGKSGVLYEFSQQLENENIPYLAVRLDRRIPNSDSRKYGADLGLRESPAICLNEVAARGSSVLILDQLDALRWTGTHATHGLDVCKQILREVSTLRKTGSKMKVVLCCRSFDLKHDPQISSWLKSPSQLTIERVSVGPLTDSLAQQLVGQFGFNFQQLSIQQRKLLKTIGNFAIWAQIVKSEEASPDFGSQTQLLRLYWQIRFQEIEKAGIAVADREALIDKLVSHMERTAVPSAPKRLLDQHQKPGTDLQSLGVLRVSGHRVGFAHQTHLDFLIANRVMEKLDASNASVIDWLGKRTEMSLFRREQLRQLLMLLADEYPERFRKSIQAILGSSTVRFHLKQLVLEVIGKIEPTDEVFSFIIGLLAVDEHRPHIESDVLVSNAHYFERLVNAGTIQQWLDSESEVDRIRALWMMRVHRDLYENIVARLCQPLIARGGDWPKHVQNVFYHDCKSECDSIFDLRLQCARNGRSPMYVDWKGLADSNPERALRLYESVLHNDFRASGDSVRTRHYSNREDPSLKSQVGVAKQYPELAVELLLPIFVEFVQRSFEAARQLRRQGRRYYAALNREDRTPPSLSQTLLAALATLARTRPYRFLELTPQLERLPGRLSRMILVRAYEWLHRDHSDVAICWLVADERRLTCGPRRDAPRWRPARGLIQRHSRHCSDEVFRTLEDSLLAFYDPDEIAHSKYCMQDVRRGFYRNVVGNAQHYLLPALDKSRACTTTVGRIGVLQRKFGSRNEQLLNDNRPMGGFVRSAINATNAERMRDAAWLRLMQSPRVTPSGRSGIRYLRDGAIDVSVEQFSRDLRNVAVKNPERFARLAMLIPPTAPASYFAAILEAVECTSPPTAILESERENWRPAPAAVVDAMLATNLRLDHVETAKRFCWLVRHRNDIELTDHVIETLITCAQHEDPPDHELCVSTESIENRSVHDLDVGSINSVRGVSAVAISHLLYDHHELLPAFRSVIEALIGDTNPSVLVAATQICLPIWNIDKDLSVELFVRAVSKDLRVGASRHARRMFNLCVPKYQDRVEPIIRDMANSSIEEVAEFGAGEIVARWVFHDFLGDEAEKVLKGTTAQRKGAVDALVDIVDQPGCSEKCFHELLPLADDESEDVRRELTKLFYEKEIVEQPGFTEFMHQYIETRAFAANPSDSIEVIQENVAQVTTHADLILSVSDGFIRSRENVSSSPDTHRWGATRSLMPLMQRLYEQANAENLVEIRDQCLDFWDQLLRLRICSGIQLSSIISS